MDAMMERFGEYQTISSTNVSIALIWNLTKQWEDDVSVWLYLHREENRPDYYIFQPAYVPSVASGSASELLNLIPHL